MSIAGVGHDRLQIDLKRFSISQGGQLNGASIILLQKGEHGIHPMEVQPIEPKESGRRVSDLPLAAGIPSSI